MAFRPSLSRAHLLALLLLVGLTILTLALVLLLLRTRPVGPKTVGIMIALLPTVILTALLAYRLWQLRSLDYWLDRDALRIFWAGDILTIPLTDITDIAPAAAHTLRPAWRRWPLSWLQPDNSDHTPAAYTTLPPPDCLAVTTRHTTYFISPQDAPAFLAAFHARQTFGPSRTLTEHVEVSPLHDYWLRRDHLAQILLATSLLLGFIFLAYFLWHYPTLPDTVPLHFDAGGLIDRVGPRRALLLLPAITLLMWFFNVAIGFVLYERQRLATYLLWGNALAVQMAGLLIGRNLLALVA